MTQLEYFIFWWKRRGQQLRRMRLRTLLLIAWSLLGLIYPCRAQIPNELPCPTGSVDMEAPTYNGSTQKVRSWLCVDATGHVSIQGTALGTTSFANLTSGTNLTAAMVVGSTASLNFGGVGVGTGTTSFFGNVSGSGTLACNGATCTALQFTTPNLVTSALFNATGEIATATAYGNTNTCASIASPAVCGSATIGAVAIPTGTNPTLVINDTAYITGTQAQIFLTEDASLGNVNGATCNTTAPTGAVNVTARSGTGFTIQVIGTFSTNPVCVSFHIIKLL